MKKLFLAIALALTVLQPVSASAQIDAGKADGGKKAAAQFATLAAGSEKTGKPPRETDPTVKKLLDLIYDIQDIEKTRSIPAQALQTLSQRIATGTQVALVYMLAGSGFTDLGQAIKDPSIGERVNLNTVEFSPEMGRYMDFQLRVQAAVIDAVLARLANAKPDELKRIEAGVADIRGGAQATVDGVIRTIAINGLTEEWRKQRMPALVAIAPKLAKFLQSDQKEQLRALGIECAGVMDDQSVKRDLESFSKLIASHS